MTTLRYCPPFKKISYFQADAIQNATSRAMLDAKLAGARADQMPKAALLAFEMNPVYTAGRRMRGTFTPEQVEFYKAEGRAEFVESLRGGHVTFHGPGQLVMYPIVDLSAIKLSVRDYVCNLEGGLIDLLEHYGLKAHRTVNTGVWLSDKEKIASIGIHVRRAITSHGISLNVCVDPFWFGRIVACNLPDAKLISMTDYVPATVQEVSMKLAQGLAKRFNLNLSVADINHLDQIFPESKTLQALNDAYCSEGHKNSTVGGTLAF